MGTREETCGRTQERFGELGPQECGGVGSVAEMEAPLNPLDIICHMRSLMPEMPPVRGGR